MENQLKTPIERFYKWEKELANNVFLRQPYGNTWKEITYAEAGQEARKMAAALKAMGLKQGAHIGLSSKNCYHWIIADLAIMMGGYISVPFYASLTADQLDLVLEKGDCEALFVGKVDHWDEARSKAASKIPVIRFPYYGKPNAKIDIGKDWDELIAQHEPIKEGYIPGLEELWTVIFTSGTTGTPKGVMHTQSNAAIILDSEQKNNTLNSMDNPVGANRFFSFLPMNHIAERTAVELGVLMNGGSVSFTESLDTFAKNLQEVQPNPLLFAVPRIWTKFQLGVLSKMPQKKLDFMLKIPILSGIIKKKIKKSLGLSEAKLVMTGASITPESLKQWYRKLDINLREVYGQTENFGGFTLMPANHHKPNTVGKPMPGTEGKIDPETGEILMKMPWIMKGYYKDEELTAKTVKDGWLYTGDKGIIDGDGFLKIIGRVKDAFKTTKGKFIVPTAIEDHFSGNDFIEQICVAGLGCPQPLALICLSGIGQNADKETVNDNLKSELKRINGILHGHEKISTVVVAKEPWSDENSLLTPTLKIRRVAINDKYGEQLRDWHEHSDGIIWE